ncbi:protein of unknown function DUF23 domain-containing protein [Aphelenchoides bicaudatus]|nr:protein of unknown function DUF23 domain-containing protein [Aphelenchoides bicaudatus]
MFMVAQVGVDQLFLIVQQTANNIIAKSLQLTANNSNSVHGSTDFPLLEAPTGPPNTTADRLIDDQVYIRSAFRVSNSEIRLTVLQDHRNKRSIFYEYGSKTGQVSLLCNLPKCIDMFAPKCKIVGFIGQIFNLNEADNHPKLRLRFGQSKRVVELSIIDARPKAKYEHNLGVCVQPIYMMSEYIVFIQFFEHWLARGATKFYMYRHSYSREVQSILDFYTQHSGVSIEFIDWSDLPSRDSSYWPSKYLFRLEVMIAIFDCLHRARYNVKYIAQTDLDEIVVVKANNNSLFDFMESTLERNPKMSSVSLVSRRAKFQPSLENISSPNELNLELFNEVNTESYYFPRPVYSKLIHRPERVFKGHIHKQIGAELLPNSKNFHGQYKLVEVPNTKAYILHLRRRLDRTFKRRLFTATNVLKEQATEWQRNFANRLKKHTFPPRMQWNNGLDVLEKVDLCRKGHEERRLRECHAVYDCVREVNTSDWFHAPNSWTHLY